ncbi:unnamed protein product [Brachionus calyciflorus]|uniref:Leucine-rich repeat-containing protein 59 n=1 Tax=Brachionus calyciflorus TaxID=104777 RepID=A0A813M6D5_9BILA|nr:unnamed protein product [Brachionus calyciflorus]
MSNQKKLNLKEKITDDCLDLSLCGLDKIPIKEILEFPKIKKLNLSYNQLTFLPQDFAKLQHIREIDLSKNRLTTLPSNFGSLVNLKTLDLLGNELTKLPPSFSELKSLQWLDLKGNPLEPELRKAAGECSDETQCKKCALNVIKYMKQVAAEVERKRQAELRKQKEEQAKREALELAKEKELKAQKKIEKEQKRVLMEQKKKETEQLKSDNQEKTSSPVKSQVSNELKKKTGVCRGFFSALSYVFFLTLILAGFYVLLVNYCESGNAFRIKAKSFANNPYVSDGMKFLDNKFNFFNKINCDFAYAKKANKLGALGVKKWCNQ